MRIGDASQKIVRFDMWFELMKKKPVGGRLSMLVVFAVFLSIGCERDSANSPLMGDTSSDVLDDVTDGIGGADIENDVVQDPEPQFVWPSSRFTLELADWGISFWGVVLDGPAVVFHTETARNGSCRLLTYEPSFCEPPCGADSTCVDSECRTFPLLIAMGDVELSGFLSGTIVVSEAQHGQYFYQSEAVTAADIPGKIGLSPVITDVVDFDLSVSKVSAPIPSSDWAQQMSTRGTGGDVILQWTNPDPTARIYLRMTTGVGTHGGISPVEVECEGPDVGELRLPGAYLDALYAQGWSCGECGGNDLWRYHAATADGPNPIQFRVQARTTFFYHPNLD